METRPTVLRRVLLWHDLLYGDTTYCMETRPTVWRHDLLYGDVAYQNKSWNAFKEIGPRQVKKVFAVLWHFFVNNVGVEKFNLALLRVGEIESRHLFLDSQWSFASTREECTQGIDWDCQYSRNEWKSCSILWEVVLWLSYTDWSRHPLKGEPSLLSFTRNQRTLQKFPELSFLTYD